MRTKAYLTAPSLCVSITLYICVFTGPTVGSERNVSVARCRVFCMKQFPSSDGEGGKCVTGNCTECWKSCNNVFDNPLAVNWRDFCQKQNLCKQACQRACYFRKTMRPGQAVDNYNIHILERHSDLEKTSIEWNISSRAGSRPHNIVYVINVRDRQQRGRKDWAEHKQTTDTFTELETEKLFPESELLIQAVGENGTLAEKKLTIYTMYDQPRTLAMPPKLNLSVEAKEVKRRVEAVLTWQLPDVLGNVTVRYTLSWFRKECHVYEDSPYCSLPHEAFVETMDEVGKEKITKTIRWLTYNTRYEVRLEAKHKGKRWFVETTFMTPFCYKVSHSFQRCIQKEKVDGIPNTTVSPDSDFQPYMDPLIISVIRQSLWTGHSALVAGRIIKYCPGVEMLKRLVCEPCCEGLWLVNMSKMDDDPESNTVRYNISWVSAFNQSSLQYSISWRDLYSNALGSKTCGSDKSFVVLELPANSSFDVKVVATYLSPDGSWIIVGEKPFTVTTVRTVTESQPIQVPASREPVKPARGELDWVIIGGTCIATGIIIAFIIFVLYKKRQSFKDVIITKTAVSKSNSYKSSMGYKADEMLVVPDDWEVDPSQLKFSTPLGQGAFGKVVTGYCDDRKVAIKVLKDCAPLSYKEDLLAEISLMKKLGAHPNIVSLVGACTLHEPIALIMEYVPYGNLQSFLKKCRQEGELRKRGRRRELTYSMVDAHGSIENGVITATDILSFARQILMAMEYLAEKKYVHRDLAARNVLLDYNKVVKVCDFGLSRDIYHDNQYKKLTSGKLPIKWMAIESLRDRVFTTQSDVWSFGILLWETVTMGASPYPNIALSDLFYMLSNGYRMEKPSNCSEELYSIMRHSWKESPKERPTFTQLRLYIEELLTRNCDYLELENIDVPLSNTDSSSLPLSDPFTTSAMAAASEAAANGRLISVSSGDEMTVDVCVHDKSTDKLLHHVEDGETAVDYRNTKQKRTERR